MPGLFFFPAAVTVLALTMIDVSLPLDGHLPCPLDLQRGFLSFFFLPAAHSFDDIHHTHRPLTVGWLMFSGVFFGGCSSNFLMVFV